MTVATATPGSVPDSGRHRGQRCDLLLSLQLWGAGTGHAARGAGRGDGTRDTGCGARGRDAGHGVWGAGTGRGTRGAGHGDGTREMGYIGRGDGTPSLGSQSRHDVAVRVQSRGKPTNPLSPPAPASQTRQDGKADTPVDLALGPACMALSSWSMGWLDREKIQISATFTEASLTLLQRLRTWPPSEGCCITWGRGRAGLGARKRTGQRHLPGAREQRHAAGKRHNRGAA